MLSSSPRSEQPQLVERRQWVRYPCAPPAGHVVAYLPGSLMAEPVRNLSAGGACLVLDRESPEDRMTVELYNVRTKFFRTLPARVVAVVEHASGGFLVGLAFRWKLSMEELRHFV